MSLVDLKWKVLFSVSVIVNFTCIVLVIIQSRTRLSWTREAAIEAENVASISCSGHGRAYLDGSILREDGTPICECNACFTGPDCSLFKPNCAVDVDSGNPMFLEPFWKQNAGSSGVMVAGWHRMGYEFEDGSLISKQLKNVIHKLHDTVGNANTSNKYILFGAGSTQLLNAAVYALSRHTPYSSPTKVVASAPYYPVYKSQTELLDSKKYKFSGDTSSWKNKTRSTNFIEFVTCPNNPDGHLNKAVLQGKFARHVYDLAYYWPHYTAIPSPMDEDVMLFTLSKLTGHAGSRFGWAIVKDKDVYDRMVEYIDLNTYGVPRETQLRALKLLNVVLQGDRREMFRFAHTIMKTRWEKLAEILSTSKRFSIEQLPSQHCAFSKQVRPPSPAFAWLKCEAEEDEECHNVLRKADIIGRKGAAFGVENRYVRLSVVNSRDDFDLLLQRLQDLVSKYRSVFDGVMSL